MPIDKTFAPTVPVKLSHSFKLRLLVAAELWFSRGLHRCLNLKFKAFHRSSVVGKRICIILTRIYFSSFAPTIPCRTPPEVGCSCCMIFSERCVGTDSLHTLSECQKGRVVKTTYEHFPLDGRPCQNARWVVLTPCQNSPICVRMHRCTLEERYTFCPGR